MIKTFEVKSQDFQSAGQVSSAIKKLLKQLAVPADIIRRIAVASYEAEINMIIHSLGGTIVLDIEDDNIALTFQDEGPGIKDIDLAMQPGYSTASAKAREFGFGAGMGLCNIKRMADYFHISSKENSPTVLSIGFKVIE